MVRSGLALVLAGSLILLTPQPGVPQDMRPPEDLGGSRFSRRFGPLDWLVGEWQIGPLSWRAGSFRMRRRECGPG